MSTEQLSQPASTSAGRAGRRRSLSIDQEAALQVAMRSHRPDDLGLIHPAWSRDALKDLIEARTGQVLDRRSVDAYAIRWGFKSQPAYKAALQHSPDHAHRWLDTKYRALATSVGQSKGRLRWLVLRELPPIAANLNGLSTCSSKHRQQSVEVRLESGTLSQWVVFERDDADALKESVLHMLLLDSHYVQSVIVVNCLPFAIDEVLDQPEMAGKGVLIKMAFGKTDRPPITEQNEDCRAEESTATFDLSDTEQRVVLRNGCLTLTYRSRATGKKKTWSLDLNECWLPPTPFSDRPVSLSQERRLCALLVESLNEYLISLGWGKSMEKSLISACRALIKLFEWSWLNDIYDPLKLTKSQFDALLHQLTKAGWAGALEIEERVKAYLAKNDASAAERMLCTPRSRASASLSSKCNSNLGTSLTAREMAPFKPLFVAAAGKTQVGERTPNPRWPGSSNGMGYSLLRQTLTSINLLAASDGPARLPFVPYPNTRKVAEKYGRAAGRTPNLRPEHVGQLLLKSMTLVRHVGPPLLRLLEEYIDKIESSRPRPGRFDADLRLLKSCQSYPDTRLALGRDISRWSGRERDCEENDTSLQVLIRDIYTAASTVIIFMNARRRDEVEHPEVGLYRGALRQFDPDLSLYVVDFYIEKSIKDYATFFVSDFTVEAVMLLEQFSGLARRWREEPERVGEAAKGHSMLFELLNLLPSGRERRVMFSFECSATGQAYHFIRSVLGSELAHLFGPHMGRRAYALIFHYRYEHATLLALAQQFGSVSIDRLTTYVTDGICQPGAFKAHELGAQATVSMRNNLKEVRELESELELVSKERVEELVSKVLLSGQARGGPFQKLVLRFHQKLVGRVKYVLSEPSDPMKLVSKALIDRGHRATPYPHGNCYARMGSKGGQARCKDPETGVPDAANASLRTCTGCPYHDYQAAHIQATQEFIEIKMQRLHTLAGSSVLAATLQKEIDEDQQYLDIRKRRLGLIFQIA